MKSFKHFINENGFPFAYVYDDDKKTIFGHTEKVIIKPKPKKLTPKDKAVEKEENTKRKLNRYFQYAKTINEEQNMDSKLQLMKFVDAIISGDTETEKTAFTLYTELKTQDILGLSNSPIGGTFIANPETTGEV